jgi:hypothetical protein
VNKRWGSTFAVTLVLLGLTATQSPPLADAVECTGHSARLLAKVPDYIVNTINSSDAGPGSAATADLCDVAAAELQPANATIGDDHYTALKVFAGTAKSGDGRAFVDAFISGLGADARNGTVTMDGRVVQSFWTSAGDGLAYAAGSTVVIGYVVPSSAVARGLDPAATQESAKEAYTKIIAVADGNPLSDTLFPGTGAESYPLRRGRYTTPTDPGLVYFKTDDVKGATPSTAGSPPAAT